MSDNSRILVVDDDPDLRWMLDRYLSRQGYAIQTVEDGLRMRDTLARATFDLVILDLSLPGEDGLSLARYLRENHDVGIIMLTAAAEVVDRVIGLEMGADDYVAKPFEPRELLARIKSVMRRVKLSSRAKEPNDLPPGSVRFGAHTLDLEARTLLDEGGTIVPITSMEFDLLKAFAENPGRVLSRDRLLDLAHNRNRDPFDRSVDIRVARLRRKIEADPKKPQVIKTVRGAGYIYVEEY